MHGISHVGPGEETAGQAPPPTHHGVRQLILQHPLAQQSRHASMDSIGQESQQSQSKSSSASSMIDLSQSQIRLSPLQRANSQISLNLRAASTSSSGLWRQQSQQSQAASRPASSSSRARMTRSQSHLTDLTHTAAAHHLDSFLASVARTNQETELRLSDSAESQAEMTTSTPIPARKHGESGGVNLRRGRTINTRWRSMDSLADREQSRTQARSRPSFNNTRDSSQDRQLRPTSTTRDSSQDRQIRPSLPSRDSRDSSQDRLRAGKQNFGPQGFTSMISLSGAESSQTGPPLPARNNQREEQQVRRSPVRTETLQVDSMSLKSSCSCTTDQTNNTVLDTRKETGETKKTKMEYLGSVPIDSKATDLNNLQVPMKNLYFKFVEMRNMGHQQLPGTIEISDTGMKVNYIRELHKGVQEIFNPFTTIAVWAAVKFVVKKEPAISGGDIRHKFAFLPLIADPDDGGKTELFYPLSAEESILAKSPSHPALFAAVMRKAGVSKQLECHGFICDSPEEAILLAANLYQALLETMKRNKRSKSAAQVSQDTVLLKIFNSKLTCRPGAVQ